MRDLNKAMKKLQEAKRLESTKLAKLVKESVVEPEDKEEIFDNKFNYKVSLDNGKTITATCSKENIEDARKYFLGKSYLNTKTGEKAKIVGVEEINSDENGFEEIKNEEFGSTSKQLTDNDPAQKVPFDSDAEKGIENAATQKPKIVAEEFGSENKDLTDNDPAQKKAFETETRKKMDDATKGKTIDDKIDESKKLNEATEEDINNENKLEKAKQLIEVIFNMDSLDETRRAAKQELKDLVYPQRIEPEKTEKKKELNESKKSGYIIFIKDDPNGYSYQGHGGRSRVRLDMTDALDVYDTVEQAQKEVNTYKNPKKIKIMKFDGKNTTELNESCNKLIEEIDEETKIKEDRLASLKTQLEVDGDQLADDEKEAIQAEIDSLEKDLYESKQLKEDWDDDDDDDWDDEDDEEYELIACNKDNDTLKSLSACIGDYEASMTGITGCPEYQELVEYAENNKEVDKIYIDYPDREYVIWTRVFGDYPEFDSLEEADEAEDEEGYDNLDESKRLKENIANDGRTKGKTLEVIYTDKDGKEKTTHFECDKEYELDGEQIREAIKSSDNDIVDIIKINESKCLTEDEDEESEERAIDANSEVVNKKISRMNVHKDVVSILGNGAIKLADKYNIQMNTILDNVEDTIIENSNLFESCENEGIQEPLNEEGCDDCSIENVDDETFTEAFTKFIKENYKNAKEFKLENVFKSGNNYRFECKLTFNSGKKVKVNLMSETKIKEGKSLIRFYENKTFKHLDENKSIMTVTVKLENKTLSCEGLRYNYRVALKENKIATIKGIIK